MSGDDLYIGPTILAPGPREPNRHAQRLAGIIVLPLLVAFVAVILLFYIFFTGAFVDGPSMLPTLHDRDYVLVTHGYETPRRGDIIVTVVDEGGQPVQLVKRVIGLPGDTVAISQDTAFVNGEQEPARGQVTDPAFHSISAPAMTVPAGFIYIMGDNRPISEDSRYIGPVPLAGVKGRAIAIYAPINRIRSLR